MTQSIDSPSFAPDRMTATTPTGLQTTAELGRRRAIVIALNVVTYIAMMWVAAGILGTGGWSLVDYILFTCFAIGLPWTVLGFWNSVIGLWLLHGVKDPMAEVAPYAKAADEATPIAIDTAILMTLRNEDPARAFLRLRTVKDSVDATGFGQRYSYFILSDTNSPDVGAAEEAAAEAWKREVGSTDAARIVYRRRTDNTGFKAGNVRDFCDRWGNEYELMLPLDADSLMSGEAIVRLTRMMQAHPKLGILQSLVVGMPSSSAFARIFQFGMRHGMRTYTMGQSWWTADCGPFWGHNALVRIKPFKEECHLPILPGAPPLAGHVLSHDQVEATLMRRAGYEVRVLPEERGSWEENPPTMLDFAKRDVRWCQGNMQYVKLLDLPGLLPMSRFQLVWAILMFLGIPAWTLMIALTPIAAWEAQSIVGYPSATAAALYVTFFLMYLSPKIAGLIDAMLTTGGVARYGGTFAVLGLGGDRAGVLVPAGRGVHHPHLDLHDRPGVRPFGRVGRPVARRLRHIVAHRVGEPVAADAVRRRRMRADVCGRAGSAVVEPAADRWLSAGDAVRGGDRRPRTRPLVQGDRPRRHPRGLRSAERGRGGDEGGVRVLPANTRPAHR